MNDSRKKPGVAFWATMVVVVALVVYPLSFGPACALCDRDLVAVQSMQSIYRPVIFAMSSEKVSAGGLIADYVRWCGGGGTILQLTFRTGPPFELRSISTDLNR